MSPSNRQQQQLSPSSPGQRSIDSDEALALVVRSRCEVLKASVKALVFGM